MSDSEEDDALVAVVLRPFIAFAVVMVFSTQNLVRHADNAMILASGSFTAFGILSLVVSLISDKEMTKFKIYEIAGLLIFGLAGFIITMSFAAQTVARLDHQCALLEVDMMKLRPARTDARELYETLQCRPQNSGTLWFPSGKGFK